MNGNDLKNIDYFLMKYVGIWNYNKENKKIAKELREKISKELRRLK